MNYLVLSDTEISTLLHALHSAETKTIDDINHIKRFNDLIKNPPSKFKEQIEYYQERLDSFENMTNKLNRVFI